MSTVAQLLTPVEDELRSALRVSEKELSNIRDEYTRVEKELHAKMAQIFRRASDALFALYPQLDSFGWAQYTPYFNDGDECIFHAHIDADSIYVNGGTYYEGWDDPSESPIDFGNFLDFSLWMRDEDAPYDQDLAVQPKHDTLECWTYAQMFTDLYTFINSCEERDLKAMFGDHCLVTIHRDGRAVVEEYGHD